MKMMKHIQTWLLITLLALSANGVANAKLASGHQNLSGNLHQSQTVLNALLHQGLEQVSTTETSGSPLATKGLTAFPRFTQTTASQAFKNGPFAGRSIEDVASGIRSGAISPSQLPVDIIVRNGQTLALNTRSLVTLRRAGLQPNQITFRNVTGNPTFENILTQRLSNNGLSNAGTDVLRITGAGVPRTSNVGR